MVDRTILSKGCLLAILVFCLLQSACIYISREIQGTVINAETEESLQDVLVTASWIQTGIAGHGEVILHVAEALTDEKGEYMLPGWVDVHTSQQPSYSQPHILFFKDGYVPLVIKNNSTYHPGFEGDTDHIRKEKIVMGNGSFGTRMHEPEEHKVRFGKKTHTFMLERFDGTDQEYATVLNENFNIGERYISSLSRLTSNKDCNWKKIPLTLLALDELGARFEKNRIKYNGGIPRISHFGVQEGPCGNGGKFFKQFKRKYGLLKELDTLEVIPDTGQKSKYFKFTGEDADYTINPQSYYASNETVLDNNTGLLWQQDTLFERKVWHKAKSYCAELNLAGINNWRLPTRTELLRIVTFGSDSPTINEMYFHNTPIDGLYWTATEEADNSSNAWTVNFTGGNSNLYSKSTTTAYAKCVSGNTPVEREFVIKSKGIVSDENTRLMWQHAEADHLMGLELAIEYCEKLTLNNYDDWRLPSINELESLVVYSETDPAADRDLFPEISNSYFWSSTISSKVLPAEYAKAITFSNGAFYGGHGIENGYRTRCVRGENTN